MSCLPDFPGFDPRADVAKLSEQILGLTPQLTYGETKVLLALIHRTWATGAWTSCTQLGQDCEFGFGERNIRLAVGTLALLGLVDQEVRRVGRNGVRFYRVKLGPTADPHDHPSRSTADPH